MSHQQHCPGVGEQLPIATREDQIALEAVYIGTTVRHGDYHGHSATGFGDGKNTLTEWMAEMDRLKIDFATIVDHRQTIHMHDPNFKADYFVGGSEPGTRIVDSPARSANFDYSMVFSDPAKFERMLEKWRDVNQLWREEGYPGYRFRSTYREEGLTTAQFRELMQDVYNAGGVMVLVHPKHQGYLTSDDPLDYYFGENSALEISNGLRLSNGDGGNMCAPSNEKAYQLWVALLALGKKIWASAGCDSHRLPNASALTSVYTVLDYREDYMAALRSGNTAPGWVGIRMQINGTPMGGKTDFTGQRLVFSVGDIYTGDAVEEDPVYQSNHSYRVELYKGSDVIMESVIDPTKMNYFAVDCERDAKFYRVVVWDDTAATRVGVSNPIWNTAE